MPPAASKMKTVYPIHLPCRLVRLLALARCLAASGVGATPPAPMADALNGPLSQARLSLAEARKAGADP
jgi:hypothetical protein